MTKGTVLRNFIGTYHKIGWIIFVFFLTGCATPLRYVAKSNLSRQEAEKTLEQAFFEHPQKFRPESVEFKDDYIQVSNGEYLSTKGRNRKTAIIHSNQQVGVGSEVGKVDVVTQLKKNQYRLYYSSLNQVELFSRRGKYVVKISGDGFKPIHFYTLSRQKAESYIDALTSLKDMPRNTSN